MPARIYSLIREPLVHFLVLGGLLFAVEAMLSEDAAPPQSSPQVTPMATDCQACPELASGLDTPIAVSPELRRSLADDWQDAHASAPSPADLEASIQSWVDQEILFREGLKLGLQKDDPGVRSRIAGKMSYVLAAQVIVPEPSEAELRDYFATHAERWNASARIDFVHVYVAGNDALAKERATDLLARVQGGARPDGLGDRFSGGRRYRGRTPEALAQAFGDGFAEHLQGQALEQWSLVLSLHGYHIVKVESRSDERRADFESARLDVQKAWQDERREAGVANALAALRERYLEPAADRP